MIKNAFAYVTRKSLKSIIIMLVYLLKMLRTELQRKHLLI